MELIERIREARKHSEYTQQVASEKLEIARAYLAQVETGKETPSGRLLNSMATVYGVNRDWLINGIGDMVSGEPVNLIDKLDLDKPMSKLVEHILETYGQLNERDQKAVDLFIDKLLEGDKTE